jgi:hypothetical protein
MDYIKQVLSKDYNLEDLLMCFEAIKKMGMLPLLNLMGKERMTLIRY